jgi:hypothetical protein
MSMEFYCFTVARERRRPDSPRCRLAGQEFIDEEAAPCQPPSRRRAAATARPGVSSGLAATALATSNTSALVATDCVVDGLPPGPAWATVT